MRPVTGSRAGLRIRTRLVCGAALAVLGACGGDTEAVQSTTTVRDSAGIQIIEHAGTEGVEAPWRIRDRPVFRTGWKGDEPAFEFLIHGQIGADGRILVTDANAQTIYLLSPDGEVLQTLGRQGEGPGEFGVTVDAAIFAGGDTILAQDRPAISTFVGEQVLRDRVSDWGWQVGRVGLTLQSRLEDGRILMLPTSWSPVPGDNEWIQAPVGTLDPETLALDTLFLHDFVRSQLRDNPVPLYGIASGRGVAIAWGRVDRAEVQLRDIRGDLFRIVRWDAENEQLGEEDWEAYESAMGSRSSPELTPELRERILVGHRQNWGGPKPHFLRLVVDGAENIWLTDFTLPSTSTQAGFVIGADGDWIGAIDFPTGLRILDISDTHILAVETNEVDVQALALYEILKPGD